MSSVWKLPDSVFAQRIGGEKFLTCNKIYKFEKIKRDRKEAMRLYPTRALIDMGVGEPDAMASDSTVGFLRDEALDYKNRGYADNGCVEFKDAVAEYMKSQFGVELNANTQILHSIGSKSALSMLPLCFVNPGDVVIQTVPGYPIFATHTKYLLGDVIGLPISSKNNFLPNFDDVPEEVWKKVKVVIVNYPNAPTGACATVEFFKKLVDLAHDRSFVVINDAAYSDLTFEKSDRLSLLSIDGAMDVGLELHSMSKGFNMTGWRIGWVCGNTDLVKAYGFVKDNTDSGQFLAIQKAAAKTLRDCRAIPENNAKKYLGRMTKIIPILKDCGFKVECPKAGFYLYIRSPKFVKYLGSTYEFYNAEEFAQWMVKELGIVVVPYDDVENCIRLSMTFGMKGVTDDEIINVFRERMMGASFIFVN